MQAGIARVIVGMRDPNPDVAGRGIERLEAAGIACTTGVLESEVRALNERFITNVTQHRPFILLKIAQTLDGFIAPQRGTSRWITSPESRVVAHELRAQCDGILVGAGTVRKDDPSLTVRDAEGTSPRRIVLSSSLDLPARALVLNDAGRERTIVITTTRAARDRAADAERIRRRGVEVVELRAGSKGMLTLSAVVRVLYERGIRSLMVEGGAAVYSQFLRDGLADRMELFISPKIIGAGESAFSGIRPLHMADAHHWIITDTVRRGDDMHVSLSPPPPAV
jgi:diaminohydroxyphosphoribosylaminopyrimidine deaminase / 5-amino-6-(5-phosphoribosylamino)uracil reductase